MTVQTQTTLGDRVRSLLLSAFSVATNYRFRKLLKGLQLPDSLQNVETDLTQIREKATASLTSVSAFLGFTVAVLAPLAVWDKFISVFPHEAPKTPATPSPPPSFQHVFACAVAAFVLTYFTFWLERYISAASVEKEGDRLKMRGTRSKYLILFLLASLFLFLGVPLMYPQWDTALQDGFPMAGAGMLILSIFFLVCALEFYDAAVGWRGGPGLHFHLASLASHCYMFGISLALMGLALNLCLVNFLAGRAVAAVTLLVLVAMTEIERRLSDLAKVEPLRLKAGDEPL